MKAFAAWSDGKPYRRRDLRNAGHDGFAGVDADDVRRIVERSHSRAFFQGFHDFICNERGSSEFFAAMDDAVADSVDGIHGFDDAAFSVGEDVEDEFDSDLVIRDGLFDFLSSGHSICGSAANREGRFFRPNLLPLLLHCPC